MKKRILSLLLVLSILSTLIFAIPSSVFAASSGTCGDNLTWTLDDNGTLTINGEGDMLNFLSKNSPWYSLRSSIITVDIQNNVNSIGNYAFYNCKNLRRVIIGNSVTSIGERAFSDCTSENLTEIEIPNSVQSIGNYAFYFCDYLINMTIPNSVATLGVGVFDGCNNLESIKLGSGVKIMDLSTFSTGQSLRKIDVDSNNKDYSSLDGVLFDKEKNRLICYPMNKEDVCYTVPSTVSIIEDKAFYCCDFTEVNLSENTKSIGAYAFWSCDNLTKINLPYGLLSIGSYAFSYCEKLSEITIPNSVTTIGNHAFYYCIKLTNIALPDSVISIGKGVFARCTKLTNATLSNNIKIIDASTFSYCYDLTGITIPNGVTNIGYSAFDCCYSLMKVTIPSSVTSIGRYAFSGCDISGDVYYGGKEEQWNKIYIDSYGWDYFDYVKIHFYKPFSEIIAEKNENEDIKDNEDEITSVGNTLKLSNNSFTSFGAVEDTLRGPKITILDKSFYLFELPIDMSVKTPLGSVKYNAEKEKYEIMLGKLDKTKLNGEDDKNKTYNEIKEFVNYCGKSTSTDIWNRYQHLQKVLKTDDMSFGFSFNATPAGYMEFDKNGKLLEGAIVYVLNMDANFKQPIPAVPIVYVKVGLGVDATGKFGIKSIESNAYSMFGSLGLDVAPYVGVGVGSSKIVNVEGGAKLKLKTQLELIKNKKLNEIFSASMTGQLYVKLKALSFINFDKKWDIAKVSIYPDFGASLMSIAETYDDMVVMPRDYANEESEFVANNNVSLFTLDNIDTSAFKTNIYPYAEPQLVKLANGNELLVWIDNDTSRSDINCTVLKYSINDGTSWSTPADIYNNGTADFSPKLAVTDNGAVLVWQKANDVLADSTTLPEMAKNIDIYYSAFDGRSWTTPTNLSNTEDTYELAPDIAVNGDEITTSWITNSDNDYFVFSGTNSIHTKVFNGTWGKNTVVATDLGSVANLNVSYIDGKAAITYTEDTDNNIETSDDVELFEIYEGQLTQITDDEVIDYGLTKTSDGYYWIHNNQLWERNINGVELVEIPILPVYLNNAKILTNGSDKVIVYEQADEYSSDLYAMYYDGDDKTWGEPVRLTEDNKKIRETSGYLTTDGALRLAFGQANIDETAEDIYGECNLMLANITEISDVQVISANCVYNEYVAGEETTVYVNVKNNSSSKISKFNIKMTANNETVVSQNVETELLSGETQAIEIPYTLPNDLTNKTYKVTVTPTEKTDDDLSNNVAAFEMGFADIKVDTTVNNKTITATISNIGCLDAENVVCTLSKADGTVIETKTLKSINAGSSSYVQFTNVTDDSAVVSITTDSEENLYANNTVSVILTKPEDKGLYIAFAEYTADKDTVKISATIANDFDEPKDVNVYVAFYKQGKLVDLQLVPFTLTKKSSQTISKELPSKENADVAKIFVWNTTDNFSPYGDVSVLNITYPEI